MKNTRGTRYTSILRGSILALLIAAGTGAAEVRAHEGDNQSPVEFVEDAVSIEESASDGFPVALVGGLGLLGIGIVALLGNNIVRKRAPRESHAEQTGE
jgi:hypothetical protein